MSTITSANSQVILSIPDVFPTPIALQGYAADDAFSVESFETAEALMGVDGVMSAGYTPNIKKFTIVFQADSASLEVMDAWVGAMESNNEVYFANMVIVLPSLGTNGKSYNFTKGALTGAKKLPDAKKVLQPVAYVISWESIDPTPT
jgi:hypothetical protein